MRFFVMFIFITSLAQAGQNPSLCSSLFLLFDDEISFNYYESIVLGDCENPYRDNLKEKIDKLGFEKLIDADYHRYSEHALQFIKSNSQYASHITKLQKPRTFNNLVMKIIEKNCVFLAGKKNQHNIYLKKEHFLSLINQPGCKTFLNQYNISKLDNITYNILNNHKIKRKNIYQWLGYLASVSTKIKESTDIDLNVGDEVSISELHNRHHDSIEDLLTLELKEIDSNETISKISSVKLNSEFDNQHPLDFKLSELKMNQICLDVIVSNLPKKEQKNIHSIQKNVYRSETKLEKHLKKHFIDELKLCKNNLYHYLVNNYVTKYLLPQNLYNNYKENIFRHQLELEKNNNTRTNTGSGLLRYKKHHASLSYFLKGQKNISQLSRDYNLNIKTINKQIEKINKQLLSKILCIKVSVSKEFHNEHFRNWLLYTILFPNDQKYLKDVESIDFKDVQKKIESCLDNEKD